MQNEIIGYCVFICIGTTACSEPQKDPIETVQQQVMVDLVPQSFKAAMEQSNNILLIDVRTPAELSQGTIVGSVNIDWTSKDYEASFAALDPSRSVLLYCQAGGRSSQALEYLRSKGFKDVRHLKGGFEAWKQAGFPVSK